MDRRRFARLAFFWMVWPVLRLLMIPFYKVDVKGRDKVPKGRPFVIAPNHVTYADFLFVMAAFKVPVTSLLWHVHYDRAKWLFSLAGCLPAVPRSVDRFLCNQTIQTAQERLMDGECIVVFPEGGLREEATGIQQMRQGYNYMRPTMHDGGYVAPVLPVTISGLWGSHWSRKDGEPTQKKARWFGGRRVVTVIIHDPVYEIEPNALQQIIEASHPPGSPEYDHNAEFEA